MIFAQILNWPESVLLSERLLVALSRHNSGIASGRSERSAHISISVVSAFCLLLRRIFSRCGFLYGLFFLLFIAGSFPAFAWPTDLQWLPIYRGGVTLHDSLTDSNGSRNIVGDSANPSGYIFNDGSYFYFRLRLDESPAGSGGQGLLQSFGWGMVLDTDLNAATYEWLIMVDGIAKNEAILLEQNTIQGTLNDPSDKAEVTVYSAPLAGNYRILAANTSFNGSPDYYLDWRFPYDIFKFYTQLSDSSPLRIFGGSSSNAQSLSASGGDLLGASDLISGFSDYITPLGPRPTTGTVQFVENLAGTGEVTTFNIGDTLYVKVTDADQNYDSTGLNTVQISLTSLHGDYATLTLTETGTNTGVFTGSIATVASITVIPNDNLLQITAATTITATYLDAIDAELQRNQARSDSVNNNAPMLTLQKNVDKSSAPPGSEIIYSILYRNTGTATANTILIADSIPLYTSYVAGSLRQAPSGTAYADATPLTDAADADAGHVNGGMVLFNIPTLAPGAEGLVFFKVIVQ